MRERTVCRAHGGATPRGTGSPHFTHGRWSKDLPTNLATRYEEARQDNERLSLNDEIALVDTRMSHLLASVGREDSVPINREGWQELRQLIELRRRLVEAQIRHEETAQRMLSVDQAMTLAAALADAVRRHVNDPAVTADISRDIERLLMHHNEKSDRRGGR